MADNLQVTTRSMKIRVIVSESDIKKFTIPENNMGLKDLCDSLQQELQITYDFKVMYLDNDFGEFFSLTDMKDLEDKGTIKIIRVVNDKDKGTNPTDARTTGELEEEHNEDPMEQDEEPIQAVEEPMQPVAANNATLPNDGEQQPMERSLPWPQDFPIPTFPLSVELVLRKGNAEYKKNGTLIKTAPIKSAILKALAEKMYCYKAYPTDEEYQSVAAALVAKHPCLKEVGSRSGCAGWKISLKFKMGNYRTELRKTGVKELMANKVQGKKTANQGIKKPRRSEVNFLPSHIEGETDVTLEMEREILLDFKAMTKQSIEEKMTKTFSLRRQQIVEGNPPIVEVMERWPVLFEKDQICAEFKRITTKPLQNTFFFHLDKFSPRLLAVYRLRKGDKLGQTLAKLDAAEEPNISLKREVVLQGLSDYLQDGKGQELVQVFQDADETIEDKLQESVMCIYKVHGEDEDQDHPQDIGIVIEGSVVIKDLTSLAAAVCLMFGLVYVLNLKYPTKYEKTFEVIQKIFLELDSDNKLSPKVQSLKNRLFEYM